LVAALWLGNDFGSNYDEIKNAVNGAAALRAYAGSPDYFDLPSLADHGPVYFAIMSVAAPQIERVSDAWNVADGRHLTNFPYSLAPPGTCSAFALPAERQRGWRRSSLLLSLCSLAMDSSTRKTRPSWPFSWRPSSPGWRRSTA
jgi:hypothetical protein